MRRLIGAVTAALLAISMPAMAADKTDIVIFSNGDRLTGEVRSLGRGILRFNTDATGTISIEWDDVAFLRSEQNIQVETEEGIRHLGALSIAAEAGLVVVETSSGTVELDSERVVNMTPIEGSRIDRLDVDVTAGYNFTKASEVRQFVVGVDADYRTELRRLGLRYSATSSNSEDNDASQRQTLELDYTRFRANLWLTSGVLRFVSNDELGLNLRTSIGAGGGRILLQTNSAALQLAGGLQVSRENLDSGVPTEDTLEAFGSLNWD